MKRALALVLLSALYGCGGIPDIPDPFPTPKPCDPATKPAPDCTCENGAWKCRPPPDPHVPVCVPPALVTSCWHQPPGSPWLYICPGGAQVSDPSQCPTSVPGTPLRTDGPRFVPPILGSVTTHWGWPFVEASGVDKIAAAGLNYTAERAPGISDDRVGFEIYERVPGTASRWAPPLSPSAVLGLLSASSPGEAEARAKLDGVFNQSPALRSVLMRGVKIPSAVPKYDLTKFSKVYQEKLRAETAHKLSKGVYVNRGLWDCWIAIHRDEFPIWWTAPYNINGVDLMKVDDFRQAPHPVILAHVREEVRITGPFPNATYSLGNEAYRCKPTREFVDGMREAVRAAEKEFGYIEHLWDPGSLGPNMDTELGSKYDFISAHGSPRNAGTVPIEVNEFAPQASSTYLANLAKAKQLGTVYHYWHDDNPYGGAWDDPAWEREWIDVMAAMKGAPPVTGCTSIPDGPDAVKDEPRPPSRKELGDAVNAALQTIRPDCQAGSSCLLRMDAVSARLRIAEELRKDPAICAAIQEGSDEVCLGPKGSGWCQGYKPVSCQQAQCPPESPDCGCDAEHALAAWAPGSVRDTWRGPATTSCLPAPPLGKFEVKNAGVNRVVVDATPKTCADIDWNRRCSTGNTCSPGGAEGNPDRLTVEAQWGPYGWTVDGAACPTCFLDGGNPLRLVAPGQDGKTIRVTGGNGVFAEIVGAHP